MPRPLTARYSVRKAGAFWAVFWISRGAKGEKHVFVCQHPMWELALSCAVKEAYGA